jgi:galactose oxidase
MAWSAYATDDFYREDRYVVTGGGLGYTQHAVWDPVTNEVTDQVVTETNHDMFCPGITALPNGDIIVTGGQNADKTSIYHLADATWTEAETMHISRGYGSSCLLSDGRVHHSHSSAASLPGLDNHYRPQFSEYAK